MAGYGVFTAEEVAARFGLPVQAFGTEIRVYPGGSAVDGAGLPDPEATSPYQVVVDGDLTVSGNLEWLATDEGGFLLVTGDLRARNVLLQGAARLVVQGDLIVHNGVHGHRREAAEAGALEVAGHTSARIVVSTGRFPMTLASQPNAMVVGDPAAITCTVDISGYDRNVDDFFDPTTVSTWVSDDAGDDDDDDDAYYEEPDGPEISAALKDGQRILLPEAPLPSGPVLEELDRLLEDAAAVTAIDLSGTRIRAFPEQLLGFPNLRRLSLQDLPIEVLPDRIGELATLTELDLSGTKLRELPATLGGLQCLRVLDITGNPTLGVPDQLGELTQLEELRVSGPFDPIFPRPRPIPFPSVLSRLPSLKKLHLLGQLTSTKGLFALTNLEELMLDSLHPDATPLPDLSRLSRLRTLRLVGSYDAEVLRPLWTVSTLEELEILGGITGQLPDDAFARMPRLRVLDLSYNDLTTLPESCYALAQLERINLAGNHNIDAETLDRLRVAFPKAEAVISGRAAGRRFDAEVDDPVWQRVSALINQANNQPPRDFAAQFACYEQALSLCVRGGCFSESDRDDALNGILRTLRFLTGNADDRHRPALAAKLAQYAQQALRPAPERIWHLDAPQVEISQRAYEALAWLRLQDGDPNGALAIVEQAPCGIDVDTEVRILLAVGRTHDAYLIIDELLSAPGGHYEKEDVYFAFHESIESAAYQEWRLRHHLSRISTTERPIEC